MRNTHIEIMDITIANLTSPAARIEAGSTKVSDHIRTAPTVWTSTICVVNSAVACDKLYHFNIVGSKNHIAPQNKNSAEYDIISSRRL